MRISLLALLLFAFAACAPKSDNDKLALEPYARVDESRVPDHAQWIFARTLKGLGSHEHYVLEAQFLSDKGLVRLQSHFNGFVWRDGVQVEFRRDGEHLYLSISTPQFAPHTSELKDFLDDQGHFKVRVEVHNTDANGTRVWVWNYYSSLQGEVQTPRPFVSGSNADVSTQALGWIFYSRGHGAKWGVEYESASILTAHREAPYVD